MPGDEELERRIRERAYQIWLEQGQPGGRDKEHWERAEEELANEKYAPDKASAARQHK
jgi:Protein of unknown function (DUF2934)